MRSVLGWLPYETGYRTVTPVSIDPLWGLALMVVGSWCWDWPSGRIGSTRPRDLPWYSACSASRSLRSVSCAAGSLVRRWPAIPGYTVLRRTDRLHRLGGLPGFGGDVPAVVPDACTGDCRCRRHQHGQDLRIHLGGGEPTVARGRAIGDSPGINSRAHAPSTVDAIGLLLRRESQAPTRWVRPAPCWMLGSLISPSRNRLVPSARSRGTAPSARSSSRHCHRWPVNAWWGRFGWHRSPPGF